MSILITGGAGYIGCHTCLELLEAGHDIVVLDSFANSQPESLQRVMEITGKEFPVFNVNLLDTDAVNRVFTEHAIDAVIHFAGFKAVGESVAKPLMYYHNNLLGTINLCEVMQQHGVKRMVFSSSATVYGLQEKMPLTEDLPVAAINPYGQTKVMLEQILTDVYASDNTWSITLLRYFNPVGAHQSGRIGENPNGIPNNLVPYITQVAVGKLPQLSVYGNDYPTEDGTCIRDYIHVMDLANGHVKALEHALSTTGVDIYNLGCGIGYSVLDVIHAFEEASGVKVPYQIVGRRAGDAAVSYSDASKAKAELGWQASRSLLEMCADSWRWQSQNPQGYQE